MGRLMEPLKVAEEWFRIKVATATEWGIRRTGKSKTADVLFRSAFAAPHGIRVEACQAENRPHRPLQRSDSQIRSIRARDIPALRPEYFGRGNSARTFSNLAGYADFE